jgi:TRAP-type C4-dicarboxylate transport system substrate-binding protein
MPLYASEIEKRTNGRVKIENYGGAELYKHDEVVDAVSTGAVEMGLNSASHWSGRNKIFALPNYFFTIRNQQQYQAVADDVLEILGRAYEEQNAKVQGYVYFSSVGIASTFPIKSVADVKGKKIRAPNEGMLESLDAMGAVPTKIGAAEVYDAIAKGAVDGACSSYTSFYHRKYYEVADYLVGPLIYDCWYPFMNLDKWNSLPGDVKKVFNEVNKEMQNYTVENQTKREIEAIDLLTKEGMEILTLSDQQQSEWAKSVQPAFDKWLAECEAQGNEKDAKQLLSLFQ